MSKRSTLLGLFVLVGLCGCELPGLGSAPAKPALQFVLPALPAMPAASPDYTMAVGLTVSETDPRLTDHMNHLPPGLVGVAFGMTAWEGFRIPSVVFSLSQVEPSGLTELTRKESTLDSEDDLYLKSWRLSVEGTFQVLVEDPRTQEVLAVARFTVVEGAPPRRTLKPAKEMYRLGFGPASKGHPKPSTLTSTVHLGLVGMQMDPPAGSERLGRDRLEISLYRIDGPLRTIESRSLHEVGADNVGFSKSWLTWIPGRYEVQIVDPKAPILLGVGSFEVVGEEGP